jgi:hypothetical protein
MTIRRSLCKVCALTHTKEIERLHIFRRMYAGAQSVEPERLSR